LTTVADVIARHNCRRRCATRAGQRLLHSAGEARDAALDEGDELAIWPPIAGG